MEKIIRSFLLIAFFSIMLILSNPLSSSFPGVISSSPSSSSSSLTTTTTAAPSSYSIRTASASQEEDDNATTAEKLGGRQQQQQQGQTKKDSINHPPVANAGTPLTVKSGDSVTLSGTGSSDEDGDKLKYSWTQISNGAPSVELSRAKKSNPQFTAPQVTTKTVLTFQLVVSDGKAESATPATVDITVEPPLSGSSSAAPAGGGGGKPGQPSPPTTTTPPSTTPTPPPPPPPPPPSATNPLTPTTTPPPPPPPPTTTQSPATNPNQCLTPSGKTQLVANAGSDQTVKPGDKVTLDGSASTGPIFRYAWVTPSNLGKSDFPLNSGVKVITFTAPQVTTKTILTFQLIVYDNEINCSSDYVDITVEPPAAITAIPAPPPPPKAVASANPTTAKPGDTVVLDGSASTDAQSKTFSEGAKLSFKWSQTGGVARITDLDLKPTAGNDYSRVSFIAPQLPASAQPSDKLTFSLTVTDGKNTDARTNTNTATVDIIVNSPVAKEICDDGIDNDSDDIIDLNDPDCPESPSPSPPPPTPTNTTTTTRTPPPPINSTIQGLIGPSSTAPLRVITKVVGANDAPASLVKKASDFTILVTGNGSNPSQFAGNELGTDVILGNGEYSVEQLGQVPSDYLVEYSADCSGTINQAGQTKTCTITNSYVGDFVGTRGTIQVTVNVFPPLTTGADAWVMEVRGAPANPSKFAIVTENTGSQVVKVLGGKNYEIVGITNPNYPGYIASYSEGCKGFIGSQETKQCTITNAIDTQPPQVVSTTPSNGIIDFPVTSNINVRFNKPIQSSSLTKDTFFVKDQSGNIVPGFIDTKNCCIFQPEGRHLSLSTKYTATVTTGVKSAGNIPMAADYSWSFTTAAVDTESPQVSTTTNSYGHIVFTTYTVQSGGEFEIEKPGIIVFEFSKPMWSNTVGPGAFSLESTSHPGFYVGELGKVYCCNPGMGDKQATFVPPPSLQTGIGVFTLKVSKTVSSLAGIPMAADKTWPLDVWHGPLYIKRFELVWANQNGWTNIPANGATKVAYGVNIRITFNEQHLHWDYTSNPPVQRDTRVKGISSNSLILKDSNGNSITTYLKNCPVGQDLNVFCFTTQSLLSPSTKYTATLSARGIYAVDNIRMTGDKTVSFTTGNSPIEVIGSG